MDSNNLPSNNYSPNTEENNDNQSNDYQNNWNPTDTYPNDANQTDSYQNNEYQNNTYQNDVYQNNGYQNSGYQNGYQNNSYVNNDYQNNWDPENTYQNNDYQNGYQNNDYQNNGYQNDWYQNGYQNGYANSYINNDKLLKTYKNVQQKAINFMNTTLPADPTKRAYAIIAIVLAVIIFGFISINAVANYHNCSSEKSANIEEYVNCHPSDFEERGDDDISATFDANGDNLNITVKFTDRVPDDAIPKATATFSDRLFLSNLFPVVEEAKNKVSSPIHLYYTILNDDGSVIYKDDFIDN